MEPSALEGKRKTAGRPGSLENPEVHENVPGHVIPILEREFDDFDNEAEQVPRRRDAGERVHRLPPQAGRLRPAPARRPDDPREAARSAASRPSRWTPSPTSSRSTRRSTRATSRRARTSRSTTSRCATPPSCIRDLAPSGLSSREGCGNTVRNVTGDPWAGVVRGRGLRPHPLRRRLRALLRAPPDDAADAAQGQDGVRRHADEDRAITGIHDIAFLAARARRRDAASRSASAAARRSCRASPRRCTTSSRPTTATT